MGSHQHATTLNYDFKYDQKQMQQIKSTGVLLSTGTGSTAWLSGMNQLTYDTAEFLIKNYKEVPRGKIEEALEKFNHRKVFSPEADYLAYFHKEIH